MAESDVSTGCIENIPEKCIICPMCFVASDDAFTRAIIQEVDGRLQLILQSVLCMDYAR
jgi:hypothetical protein